MTVIPYARQRKRSRESILRGGLVLMGKVHSNTNLEMDLVLSVSQETSVELCGANFGLLCGIEVRGSRKKRDRSTVVFRG